MTLTEQIVKAECEHKICPPRSRADFEYRWRVLYDLYYEPLAFTYHEYWRMRRKEIFALGLYKAAEHRYHPMLPIINIVGECMHQRMRQLRSVNTERERNLNV